MARPSEREGRGPAGVARRAKNLVKFRLEGLLLRGAGFRLLLIALFIGVISILAGTVVLFAEGGFDSPLQAIWWAFLRLTDPGYLGDDTGTVRRLVSTVLTILGYVIFMGALVAIMIQWLNETLRELEGGYTPIAADDHVLVVGYNSRTTTILSEMLESVGRVQRFLRRHDATKLRLVLLDDEVSAERRYELADRLGELYSDRQITLRSGTPLRIEHLLRVDYLNAAAVILSADDYGPERAAEIDTRTIKTLLSMAKLAPQIDEEEDLPLVVAEINDTRRVPMAVQAYAGPIEVVASDVMVGCMLAQSVLHRGLNQAFVEILLHGVGNAIHVVDERDQRGQTMGSIAARLPHGIALGVVRPRGRSWSAHLCLPRDYELGEADRLVVLATSHEDAVPENNELDWPEPLPIGEPAPPSRERRRVLVLGWSNHLPAMLHDLSATQGTEVQLDVVSIVPEQDRREQLRTYGAEALRVRVNHVEGDFTIPTTLSALDPADYDAVVLVASDWPSSDEETDARTIVGYLLLQDLTKRAERKPRIIVELTDPGNAELFDDPGVEVVASPLAVGAILAHVALRPELRIVYEELVGVRGPELTTRLPSELGIEGGEVTFARLHATVAQRGHVLVGMFGAVDGEAPKTTLNPPRSSRWDLGSEVRLVLLTAR